MFNSKEKKEILKREKGITLVALVVTIIILLILAGITISSLTKTGIFQKANEAKQKSEEAEENQTKILSEYENELDKYISGNKTEVKKVADNIGIVLSTTENTTLEDAYGNKIVVPAGFKITNDATTVNEGIVIEDTTLESTAGSQFVWVPVGTIYTDKERTDANKKIITLGRYDFNEITGVESVYSGSYIEEDREDTSMALKNLGNTIAKNITNFKNSVAKNGGYYIGRYEARKNSSGAITEVKNDTIWNNIYQPDAAMKSQNMYNSNKFTSDLINSYAWDTAITFIQKCTNNTNYANQASLNNSLDQTGTTSDKQCNIFDMSSNILEWSTETSNSSDGPCIARGGEFAINSRFTSNRISGKNNQYFDRIGFRPILYVNN